MAKAFPIGMQKVSVLASYLFCPRKVFLQTVLAQPVRASLVRGSLRHSAHEIVNQVDETIVKGFVGPMTAGEIEQSYNRHYQYIVRKVVAENLKRIRKAGLDPGKTSAWLREHLSLEAAHRARNVRLFMEENKVYGDELWLLLTPKLRSEYSLSSERLQLSGTVDELEVYKNQVVPVELKTGRAPQDGVWPGHQLQMAAFMMLLEERFTAAIPHGIIRYLDDDASRLVVMNPFLRMRVLETRDKVTRMLHEQEIPPRVANENKCSGCGLRTQCMEAS